LIDGSLKECKDKAKQLLVDVEPEWKEGSIGAALNINGHRLFYIGKLDSTQDVWRLKSWEETGMFDGSLKECKDKAMQYVIDKK
jgi:hypothetical protein